MAEQSKVAASGAIDRAFSLNIAALVVIVLLYGATILVSANTMYVEMVADARQTAERWLSIGIGAPNAVASFVAGEPRTATQQRDLEIADRVGGLNGYRIYDADGNVSRVHPGHLSSPDDRAGQALVRRAVETGEVQTQIDHAGRRPGAREGGGTVYVNVYKPVELPNGQVAVVMTQIDTSALHKASHVEFGRFILLASGLAFLALIFTVASTILLRRQRAYDRRIDRLLNYDMLTGIANRVQFMARASSAIARGRRGKERLAVYMVDLDCFKAVNDGIGYTDADALIAAVARRLVACAPDMLVARIGGDEFAILDTRVVSEEAARDQAQTILEAVRASDIAAKPLIGVSASVGYTVRSATHPLPELMREAEVALYVAKQAGRAQAVLFKDGMGEDLRHSTAMRFKLHEAVRHKRLELFFQPLHRADGTLASLEALVRLPDGLGGYFSTEMFIPIAEEMGLISEIGDFVLNTACRVAMGWPAHIGVSVNASPQEFVSGDIVARVAAALQRSGLNPRRLEVEITESLFIANTADVGAKLHALRRLGVSVVMDDFGSGYSSLQYLCTFPFDKLKVDRSCFKSLGESERVPVMLRTIRAMADAMNLRVTAEGIETEAHRAFAVTAGYDELQGHLFSRPIPQSAVDAYIRAATEPPAPRQGKSAPLAGSAFSAGRPSHT